MEEQIQALEQRIQELESILAGEGVLPESFVNKLQGEGFIKEVGPRIITYTNPAGRDFYSTFVEAGNEVGTLSIEQAGYLYPISGINTSTDTFTLNSHPFSDDNQVSISTTDTPPGGLSLSPNIYYVINSSSSTLQLSATLGGAAINITSQGSGRHYLSGV
jgi:hypothetical protein